MVEVPAPFTQIVLVAMRPFTVVVPAMKAFPCTERSWEGEVVPIPTRPSLTPETEKMGIPVGEVAIDHVFTIPATVVVAAPLWLIVSEVDEPEGCAMESKLVVPPFVWSAKSGEAFPLIPDRIRNEPSNENFPGSYPFNTNIIHQNWVYFDLWITGRTVKLSN